MSTELHSKLNLSTTCIPNNELVIKFHAILYNLHTYFHNVLIEKKKTIELKSFELTNNKSIGTSPPHTLDYGINVPLHLLIFGIFSRGYGLILN